MTENPISRSRLEGLDLARYLAFVGMVIVNFKIAMGAEGEQGLLGFLTSSLEGRAAATFVVLAGIGLGLAARKRLTQTVGVTIRRAAFLLVLGLLNMTIFEADILHYYAFYFLFGVLLLALSNRWLIVVMLGLNLAFVAMILTLDYDAGWNWDDYTYAGFWTPTGFVRNLFFNGWHPVIPWLGFLLFGVVLSRQALSERRMQWMLLIVGFLTLAATQALSAYLTSIAAAVDMELVDLVSTEPVPPMPLYFLAGVGASCAIVGVCLLVENALKKAGVLDVLIPAGRQTLTLYIAHILIGMGTLEAIGLLGEQTLSQSVLASVAFCAAATVYAFFWAKAFKRGPIEALMRKLAG
ncbi:DUF418 domain-containing protein [uncultured Pelagimonas sp.]|uniref:DUF418 domain-containing protein n=1 Tax=uncultured Pelagimonas sp. TaxID=1618102 RepID=UPI00262B2210|nr:DUF418 domain-containing protein [uncultured Pelagimonas sp.]